MKEEILGFGIDCFGEEACCDLISDKIRQNKKFWLACFNPHSYAVSKSDAKFSVALESADILVPDGVGVVIASRILSGVIVGRVTGSDVFYGLQKRMNEKGGAKVFFLGGTEETLANICERMDQDYPNINVVGTYSPPFKPEYNREELDHMIAAVNEVQPDVLWVGMTAPKQEKWIMQNLPALDVKFAGAIGAVFDFYTGRVKRSPPIFQKMGLEWLPRLLQQPKRLWRRMVVSAPIFLIDVLKSKASKVGSGSAGQ